MTIETVEQVSNLPITKTNTPTRVSLDDMASDLDDLDTCDRVIAQFEAQRKEIRERIQARIGEGNIGTRAGQDIWAYSATAKFSEKRFREDNPEIADAFTHAKVTQVLNTEELKRANPALYQDYLVRSLRPLGSKK